ncbi:MAG: hypothetical protein RI894_120 [Bacteroidota bacterium]
MQIPNFLLSDDEENIGEMARQFRYVLLGVIIVCITTGFISLFQLLSIEDFLNWLLFSVVITLCINNGARLIRYFTPAENISWWQVGLVFYTILGATTLIGLLISYSLISLVYGIGVFSWHNIYNGLVISTCISLVVGTMIFVNRMNTQNNRIKLQEQALELARLEQLKTAAELASLQSRINPHFLYNALNAIAALIHDEPDAAEEMTINLSKLFRYSINTQNQNYATIREELEILDAYLAIEKVRFGSKLNFSIAVEAALYAQKIPRFLLQPLVENAVKHGVSQVASTGFIAIDILKNSQNDLQVSVHDNGLPFPEPLQKGFGITSTTDKLRLLYGANNFSIVAQNSPKKQIIITLSTFNKPTIQHKKN